MKQPASAPLAIIGIGEVPTGWHPEKSCIELAVEAVKAAIDDARIPKAELGAFFLVPPLARERDEYHLTFCRLQEEMGMHGSGKVNMQIANGCASPLLAIEAAGSLIRNGDVTTAVIYNAQNYSGASADDLHWFQERNNRGYHREWERHFGINIETMAALVTQRYMAETHTSEEDIAGVTESLSQWSVLNGSGPAGKTRSAREVLESGITASPMRAAERGRLADGASAFIVTTAERAREISARLPVYVLGLGHSGAPALSMVQKPGGNLTRLGFEVAAQAALQAAGRSLADIDLFELYAAFPVFYILQVEELGLCPRGQGGAFFRQARAAPGGSHPVATHGGIQRGDTGLGLAMSCVVESVRQLRHEAGSRQVAGAKTALVSGFGNQMLDSHALILGTGAHS